MAWESDYNGGRERERASKYRFLLVSRRRRDVTAAWRGYGCATKVGYELRMRLADSHPDKADMARDKMSKALSMFMNLEPT